MLLASPVQSTAQFWPAKPASHSQSVPLPVALQSDELPWPEHASSRASEHWYEQSDVAKPESHVHPAMPVPSAEQSVALPCPEQHSMPHETPA